MAEITLASLSLKRLWYRALERGPKTASTVTKTSDTHILLIKCVYCLWVVHNN